MVPDMLPVLSTEFTRSDLTADVSFAGIGDTCHTAYRGSERSRCIPI